MTAKTPGFEDLMALSQRLEDKLDTGLNRIYAKMDENQKTMQESIDAMQECTDERRAKCEEKFNQNEVDHESFRGLLKYYATGTGILGVIAGAVATTLFGG